MKKGVNKVILLGNLGHEPDIRVTPAGMMVVMCSLATTEKWVDKQTGKNFEKTEWHQVVILGQLAETAQMYLKKGIKVYFEGKLQHKKWKDKMGIEHYKTEIMVDHSGDMQIFDESLVI